MSTSKSKPAMSAEDRAAQALLQSEQWLATMDEAEKGAVGTFYGMSEEYKDWHFVRCGNKKAATAQALAHKLIQMGYVVAEPSVRMKGTAFAQEGEGALILMCPPQVRHNIKRWKAQQRIKRYAHLRQQFGKDLEGLKRQYGAEIALTDKRTGREASPEDVFDSLVKRGR